MYRFFDVVTRPLLEALKPESVVEIGSDHGHGTRLLAEWCAGHGAILHVVDPLPKYDVDEWRDRWPGTIRFYLDLSLNALVDIPASDVALIDGDHNWYTVNRELEILGRNAANADRVFPLTLLHDVGWPYGRRDLYYDPETIPAAFRHPHRMGGLRPDQRALLDHGFNDHLENAIHEGTPRNGVRTAVEDYVEQHGTGLTFHVVPGLHGLGVLVHDDMSPPVHEAVARVIDGEGLTRLLGTVEADRLDRLQEVWKLQRTVTRERDRVQRAHAEAQKHEERAKRLRASHDELSQATQRLIKQLDRERAELEGLRGKVSELRGRIEQMRGREEEFERELRQASEERQELQAREKSTLEESSRLRAELDEQKHLRKAAERKFNRLRSRRSVRATLAVARLARPIFRLRRGQRVRGGSRPVRSSETTQDEKSSGASEPGYQVDRGLIREMIAGRTGRFFEVIDELIDDAPSAFLEALHDSEAWDHNAHDLIASTGPLVSIIMPTYNRAHLIGMAIESVISQSYANWELLVCDDGSDDDTASVVSGFADPRIRYLGLDHSGAARARNSGLRQARGELVAYLDSDNIWHPEFLEVLVAVLVANPGRYCAYSKYVDVKIEDGTLRLHRFRSLPFDYERLAQKNYIDLNAFVHRRYLYDHFGGFNEELVRQQDWALVLKFAFLRDPLYVDRFLTLYQRNEAWGQITKVHRDNRVTPAIIADEVAAHHRNGLPAAGAPVPSFSVLSWDISRNHFSKAYNICEAVSEITTPRLLGFRFFDEPIFPPYAQAEPGFDTVFMDGGTFPAWAEALSRMVAAVEGDVAYAVKPRLPSLGVALLANYHFGTPVVVEVNDLESVVTSPKTGQVAERLSMSDVDPADPDLLNPYGAVWTGILESLVPQLPLRATHNHHLDEHFGGGAFYVRNPKDERHFDPTRYDRRSVRRELGFSPRDRVVLFGGMVRRHKGVFELLEILDRAGSSYRLLVVGSRESPDQRRLVDAAGDRVKILEPQDRNAMAAVNLASDVVVLWLDPEVPASRYQMPFKLTDALAMEVPVIANDIGGLGELARSGVVRSVPYGDVDALVSTMDELFRDRAATQGMVAAGRRLFLRQFSYNAVRANLRVILTEAAGQPGTLPVAVEFARFFSRFYEAACGSTASFDAAHHTDQDRLAG